MRNQFITMMIVSLTFIAFADRGSIPFNRNVQIFEPDQNALIVWNGEEELLLLSTNMSASENTQVLEILPLPSEPHIEKGDMTLFKKSVKIINDYSQKRFFLRAGVGYSSGEGKNNSNSHQPAEITFHQKFESHDIVVTHVLNKKGFVKWVQNYFKTKKVTMPQIPVKLGNVIGDYLNDGYTWFAFDVINLKKTSTTNNAIQYTFKSEYLYYPLRITKTETGYTSVNLIIISNHLLTTIPEKSFSDIQLASPAVELSLSVLNSISIDIAKFLGNPKCSNIRIWHLEGLLDSFTKDLLAR